MKIMVSILFSLLATTSVYAQGRFTAEGESTAYAGAAYFTKDDSDGFAAVGGYSIKGNVDFGLQYSRQSLGNGRTYASVIESFQGHLSKPTPERPYGLTVLMGLEQGRFHYPADDSGYSSIQTASGMTMGGEVTMAAYGEGRWDIYPYMGITLQMAKLGGHDLGWTSPFHMGGAIVFDDRLVLDGAVTAYDSGSAFVGSIVVMF